jgi:hypothetical protein
MLRRERSWALHTPGKDLWSVKIGLSEPKIYTNNVTQGT